MKEITVNGIKIFHIARTVSTNKDAMALDGATHLCAVLADSQDGGRGRLGRSFFSPNGGLYLSLVL